MKEGLYVITRNYTGFSKWADSIFGSKVLQIILYGSAARNEATPESDVDIAIILQKSIDMKEKDLFITWAADMDLKYEKVFSIIDIEKESLDKWGYVFPFYENVCREGVHFGRQHKRTFSV